jgi:arylsulfatase A-like enzyme
VEGKRVKWRTDFYYEHHFAFGGKIPETEGVRSERWKYLRYVSAHPAVEELYDLKNDPLEERNLATNKNQRKRLTQMRQQWADYRKSLE